MAHQPVMLEAAIAALRIQVDGIYLDGTLGRSGHARAILSKLGVGGRLYALDRDPAAIAYAKERLSDESRLQVQHGDFSMLKHYCDRWEISGRLNGLLLDLGVSSPQLDQAERGFSFSKEGPLDMRMDYSNGLTAQEWLATASEQEIADVLWRFGEERRSRVIARQIVQQRQQQTIQTTTQLANIVAQVSPRGAQPKHPATRTFQAIRIFINRELDALETVLQQSLTVLASGARLAVISFHSLEDRLVKRFMRKQARGVELPRGLPVQAAASGQTLKVIGKAIKPSAIELEKNPRARSAVLRVAERL